MHRLYHWPPLDGRTSCHLTHSGDSRHHTFSGTSCNQFLLNRGVSYCQLRDPPMETMNIGLTEEEKNEIERKHLSGNYSNIKEMATDINGRGSPPKRFKKIFLKT